MAWIKDPDAVLDYQFDWSAWLGDDTLVTVNWTVPDGLTMNSSSNTATAATVWLAGGTAGSDYTLTCRITTAGGHTDERGETIRCRDR